MKWFSNKIIFFYWFGDLETKRACFIIFLYYVCKRFFDTHSLLILCHVVCISHYDEACLKLNLVINHPPPPPCASAQSKDYTLACKWKSWTNDPAVLLKRFVKTLANYIYTIKTNSNKYE